MASRRVLLIGVIVAVLIVVGIAYYVFVARSEVGSSPSLSGSSGGSGPIRVVVLSVEKGVTAVKYKVAEANGVTTYTVLHVKNGLEGYLLRIKASNTGSETYALGIVLITSMGRQLGLLQGEMGIEMIVTSPSIATEEQKTLLEQAREYPRDMMQAIIAGTIPQLTPGASTEQILLYGLQPGEKPVKLHVIAKSLSGHVIEFDIPIKG